MPDRTPGEIQIRRLALTVLQQVLRAAQPLEGCALLLGDIVDPAASWRPEPAGGASQPAPAWRIGLIWPCLNVWEPAGERHRRFRLDPREQLLAQRWGRERCLRVLGAAHSHPCSAAEPSATDLELAFPATLQLILSPLQGWDPACWWLESGADGRPAARPLRWRMVD